MTSIFKLSLFAAALAVAVPSVAMAAPATAHKQVHKYYKGHRYSKKAAKRSAYTAGDQETADLNARSLQVIQSVNNGNARLGQPVVPNPEQQLPPSARVPLSGNQSTSTLNQDSLRDVNRYDNSGRRVIVAPSVQGPQVNAPGAVNPNNMPPVQY